MLFRWGAYQTIFAACCPQIGKVFVKKGFLKKIEVYHLQLVLLFDLKAAKVSLKKEKHCAHKKFYTI